ncbi:MAG: DUF2232 domain-containing protein [bacterium]
MLLTIFLSLVLELLIAAAFFAVPAALFAQSRLRSGPRARFWLPLAAVGLAAGLLLPPVGVVVLAMITSGLLLDYGVRRRWDWRAVSLIGGAPIMPLAWSVLAPLDRPEVLDLWVERYRASMDGMMSGFPGDAGQEEQFFETLRSTLELTGRLAPSLTLLTGLTLGVVALGLGLWWLRRRGEDPGLRFPAFCMWNMPEQLSWLAGAAFLAALTAPGPLLEAAYNVLLLLAILYSIQGLAVAWYGFEVRGTPGWARGLFVAAVIVTHLLGMAMLAVLGLLETWVPFRAHMAEAAMGGPDEEDR